MEESHMYDKVRSGLNLLIQADHVANKVWESANQIVVESGVRYLYLLAKHA